jgi:nucleoside-diphosphate-sugar epimerase
LVEALAQAPNVKQIIYLSSCSVYGDRQGEWVDETARIEPLEHNSHVLHQSEQIILQAASHDQKVCVLRLGGIYGPDREIVSMFGGMAGMTMPGKGDRFINWIHRDDIVGAIEFARLNELEGIYNLVDDSQLTIKEQVKLVCSAYGLPPVQWDASQLSIQRKSLKVSNQKIKAAGYDLIHPQLLV